METATKTAIEALEWRYATKAYDTSKKVSSDDLQTLKDAVRLSASSFGLQPYKVMVITEEAIRQQLRAKGYGQPQITDASHLFVFAAQKSISSEDVADYMENIAKTRGMAVSDLAQFSDYINGSISTLTPEQFILWNSKQTYIALGTLLLTAAELGVDATPMEGFEAAGFDEVLGLSDKNLTTSVICAIGYRSTEDGAQHYAKVRKAEENLFEFI